MICLNKKSRILKTCICLLLIILTFQESAFCLASEYFSQTYGHPQSNDFTSSILQDETDGSYLIVGSTIETSVNCSDAIIMKISGSFDVIWKKTFGGPLNDGANDIIQTSDGGYAVIGYTDILSKGDDAWLIKLDVNGDFQWNKTFGGIGLDSIDSIIQTKDEGYALCGFTESFGKSVHDAWFIRLDSEGNTLWMQTYGVSDYNEVISVIETTDGGYALAGRTQCMDLGGLSFWAIKVDSFGNMQWNKLYGQKENDFAKLISQTSDGGYTLLGSRFSYAFGNCSWLIKVNALGVEQWNQTIRAFGENSKLADAVKTSDSGYALTGYSNTGEAWLTKVNSEGIIQWAEGYGKSGQNPLSVFQSSDGQYLLGGIADLDVSADFLLVLTQKTDDFVPSNSNLSEHLSPTTTIESQNNLWLTLYVFIFLIALTFSGILRNFKKNHGYSNN